MSYTLKLGKPVGTSTRTQLFELTAELQQDFENLTLKEIAKQLATQAKIGNGEVVLSGILFKTRTDSEEVKL